MRYGLNVIFSVACCSILAACATAPNTPSATPNGQGGRDIFAGTPQPASPKPFDNQGVLAAYHWQLTSIAGRDNAWYEPNKAALKAPVSLTFNAEQRSASVRGLCNVVNAGYDATTTAMTMKPGVRTMMACTDTRVMTLENHLAEALAGVTAWKTAGTAQAPRLQLAFANGSEWTFNGVPTDATRYGSAAERIFLEVAPRTRNCNDGVRARQCLEVRRVEYDEGGLRKGAGPWELFYETIEGFTHQPGERSVLRINRYARSNAPADASRYVYVLDMRVSTEIAR